MIRMRFFPILLGLLLLLSSCGVILRTVVAPEYKKASYNHILVVVNEKESGYSTTIAKTFEESLKEHVKNYQAKAEVYIDNQQSFSRIFADNLENQKLNQRIQQGNYDLIISLRPVSVSNDGMIVYEAVAMDTENGKEIWGAAIDTVSSKRAKKYGKSLGKNLLKQLKEDAVIK